MRKRMNAQAGSRLAVTQPARSLAQRQCERCGTVFAALPESTDLCELCEARWQRHREAHERFAKGAAAIGLDFQVKEGRRLPQLNAVKIPAGFDDKTGRKELLEKHGIEIGGGLGDLAGKVWRIGLMGYGARTEVVDQVLAALKSLLKK